MRHPLRSLALAAALGLLLVAPAAHADALSLVTADDRGVTLRLDLPAWSLASDSTTRRSHLVVAGLDLVGVTGRPELPYASALVAVPPGAMVTATVLAEGTEEQRDHVALAIARRTAWVNDAGGLGWQPTVEDAPAILDGPWPKTEVEVGEPFVVRHQRMVAVRVNPFRYDEATGRLWAKRSVTVRIAFVGGTRSLRAGALAAPAADAVLDRGLINAEQARGLRLGVQPARAARFAAFPTAGAPGFDETYPETRVRVDSTGVMMILYDDLPAAQFSGLPVSQISVHRHEYVENQSPPYETLEVPCEVLDYNGNGVFDSGDAIVVYAQTWAKRARPSIWQRVWGDADYLYVTHVTDRPGLRVSTRAGWNGLSGLTPLASYPQTIHYEHDSGVGGEYNSFPPDTTNSDPFNWVLVLYYYTRPDSFTFDASDLDTSQKVNVAVQFVGRRNAGLISYVRVKNGLGQLTSVVDSTLWFGALTRTFTGTVNGSAVTEGSNALEMFGHDLGATLDGTNDVISYQSLNWYEVTLWRAYRAIKGVLPCTSGGASGDYQVRAGGFASNAIEVWDVTDSTNAVRLTLDPSHLVQTGSTWSVEFQDNTPAGQPRRYVVFDRPPIVTADAIAPVNRSALYATAGRPDYLLVVPGAWASAVAPLAAARRAQGLSVLVAPYEAIRDEFNGGRASAYAIKRFIRFAYTNWGTRFVALMGDAGGQDPQDKFGTSSQEWLPTMMIPSPIYVPTGNSPGLESIPSDAWYAWCVDPACTDPSLQPKIHDLFVGRLPVNSAAEAAAISLKLAKYEQVTPDQTWRRDLLLCSDDQFSGGGVPDLSTPDYCFQPGEAIFSLLNSRIHDMIVNDAGLTIGNTELFDLGVYLANEPTDNSSGRVCRLDRTATQLRTRANVTFPQLFPRLDAGRLWWNYQGHANETVLTHENLYMTDGDTDDWRLLTNTDRPFLFTAFSCHANNFTRYWEHDVQRGPCLGEEFVTAPTTGAIASWASTGFEIIPVDNSRPGQPMSHINTELARALFWNVPTDSLAAVRRDPFAHVQLGEAIGLAVLRWQARVPTDPNQRDVGISYELLGDPATTISIAQPQTTVAANGVAVTSGLPLRLHTLSDTLRIDADVVSNQQIRRLWVDRTAGGVRDSLGVSALTISPAFPDTARTQAGGRRFHVTLRDTLTTLSYLYTVRSVDLQGLPSSFDVALPFQTVLRADGNPVNNGDALSPTVNLTMLVLSPAPIADPGSVLRLRVNGALQAFTFSPNVGDPSGREWVLSWTHPAYAIGDYAVEVDANAVAMTPHTFRVTIASTELRLADAMLFPNPFDDDLGAFFSFNLESGNPADVLIRVYTSSGKLVYRRFESALSPGYHQLPWDGRDAEGDKLANGVYFYRMEASNGSSRTTFQGSLVKLRKPRRVEPLTP